MYVEKPVINIGDVNHSQKREEPDNFMVGGVSQNILEEGGISFDYCSCIKYIWQKADAN